MVQNPVGNVPFTPEAFEAIKQKIEASKPRMRKMTYAEIREKSGTICQIIDSRVGCINAIAAYVMYDAKGAMEKTEYWESIKGYVNAAIAEYEKYENDKRRVKYRYDGFVMWSDMADNLYDMVKDDLRMFHLQFAQVMTKHHVPDAMQWAWVETAHTMLSFACSFYDAICDTIKMQERADVWDAFIKDRMTKAFSYWKKVMDFFKDKVLVGQQISFNTDENCMRSYKIISTKLRNEELFIEAAFKTIHENKDMVDAKNYADVKEYEKKLQQQKDEQAAKTKALEEKYKSTRLKPITEEDLQRLAEKFNHN